jgi:hypothetical protein
MWKKGASCADIPGGGVEGILIRSNRVSSEWQELKTGIEATEKANVSPAKVTLTPGIVGGGGTSSPS